MPLFLKHFTVPCLVIFSLIGVTFKSPQTLSNYADLLTYLPFALVVVTSVISLYLLQYAYLYTALVYGATYVLIQVHLQTSLMDPVAYSSFLLVVWAFPVLMMAVVFVGHKALRSGTALILFVVMSSLYWWPFLMNGVDQETFWAMFPSLFSTTVLSTSRLTVGMLITVLPVFTVVAFLYLHQPNLLRAHWLVGLGCVYLMFAFFAVPLISSIAFVGVMTLLLVALLQEAFQLAYIDELTGIPGRKAMEKYLVNLPRHYCIAMVDVDHFKKFNDTYGHDVGDQVLRMVAAKIALVTGSGQAFRYGGEEFTIVFARKNSEQAMQHLEAVRQTIADYKMLIRGKNRPEDDQQGRKIRHGAGGKSVSVTVSMGVADRLNSSDAPEDVIKAADKSLYAAKKAGRNRVVAK